MDVKASVASTIIVRWLVHQNGPSVLISPMSGKTTDAVLNLVGQHLLRERKGAELQLFSGAKPHRTQLLVAVAGMLNVIH